MKSYRSLLAVVFAFVAVFLVSCSAPIEVAAPAYSPTQMEQVARYQEILQGFRDRFPELATSISKKDWVDVGTFIHGPLGELRQKTGYVIRNLINPSEVAKAKEVANQLFDSLEAIDKAAADNKQAVAVKKYNEAIAAFDQFLELLPKS
ncbi:MAG: photosystem II protein PsbQ [Coleofasciculaceae cyanobacterium SM2_1_6]|nr:photosystem II protein PsbQ [Coleofasciculaceae cyanobacterium SM2_1_6]